MRENENRVDGCRNTEPYCDGFIQLPNFVLGLDHCKEKLMKEFGALFLKVNQTPESAIKEIKALLDQKAN